MAETATVTEMLVGACKRHRRFTPLVMGLGDIWGKTQDHKKVRKRTDYRCSSSPGGIRVVDLYFP
jgi:hypothetical protein